MLATVTSVGQKVGNHCLVFSILYLGMPQTVVLAHLCFATYT
jgi:hypothetical protein